MNNLLNDLTATASRRLLLLVVLRVHRLDRDILHVLEGRATRDWGVLRLGHLVGGSLPRIVVIHLVAEVARTRVKLIL
jgi:hypothetical protein